MQTIYGHNITTDEITKLKRMIPGRQITGKSDYERTISDDLKFADLYRLYSIRGEEKQAQYYFHKIEDATLKYLLKENE